MLGSQLIAKNYLIYGTRNTKAFQITQLRRKIEHTMNIFPIQITSKSVPIMNLEIFQIKAINGNWIWPGRLGQKGY